jgi:prepilin-type N-terminal cleavage/methylation domain-containing protein
MKPVLNHLRKRDEESPDEGGFTLIELLIVVLILGILAAIVAFAVGAFTSTSAVAACNTDAKTVESGVAAYEATNTGSIPTSGALTSSANGGPYLHNWPGNSSYYTIGITGTGAVTVKLTSNDAGHKAPYKYELAKYPFNTGAPYDTWTWGTGTNAPVTGTGSTATYPAKSNVCAGA